MTVNGNGVGLVDPFSYPLMLCLAKTKFELVNRPLRADACRSRASGERGFSEAFFGDRSGRPPAVSPHRLRVCQGPLNRQAEPGKDCS